VLILDQNDVLVLFLTTGRALRFLFERTDCCCNAFSTDPAPWPRLYVFMPQKTR